jgi:anaerobic ribonucleoside-triphosphate reductase activating protein
MVDTATLAKQIIEFPDLEGLTISGGEPMNQAPALVDLVERVTSARPHLSVIVFSGYTLSQLRNKAASEPGVAALLKKTDLLIDGQYVKEKNDGRGLRGSSNQGAHFLSDRYVHLREEIEGGIRRVEMHLTAQDLLLVGVPSRESLGVFHLAAEALKEKYGGFE